ncbi:MAG: transposase, partial [Flexilinea sp.]|nr:transposase [Flexilinea sp.]
MARYGRKNSAYGYYHIMVRGVNRQDIFLDDCDRTRFIDTLKRFSFETKTDIIVYCLMTNHVHLLVSAPDGPDVFMKKLSSSYVYYFNHRYGRIGHLFQDRFKSEAIESDDYLLTAARYILQNPQKAGICKASNYQWSNWKDIAFLSGFTKPQLLYDLAAGNCPLQDYLLADNDDICLDIDTNAQMPDLEAEIKIKQILGNINLKNVSKETRNHLLVQMKDAGITAVQIEKFIGISRHI